MKRYNIVRAKEIEGREKPIWLSVGTMVEFDNGGRIIEMNDRKETYQVFEQKPNEAQQDTPQTTREDIENIPF